MVSAEKVRRSEKSMSSIATEGFRTLFHKFFSQILKRKKIQTKLLNKPKTFS